MVVITVASRKGGSGKSTLTANLAAFADRASRRCLLIDADPQGSLSLWHHLRKTGEPPLRKASRGIEHVVAAAREMGFEWVFIDTPPQMTGIVGDAIEFGAVGDDLSGVSGVDATEGGDEAGEEEGDDGDGLAPERPGDEDFAPEERQ